MSWLSSIVDDVGAAGNALIHGDITGGQYQATPSQWLGAGEAAATVASLGLGAGTLAGGIGVADAAGIGVADAATTAAPTLVSEAGTGAADVGAGSLPAASFGTSAPDLSGFLGGSPVTTDTGLPFAGGAPDATAIPTQAVAGGAPDLSPNAYVAQNFAPDTVSPTGGSPIDAGVTSAPNQVSNAGTQAAGTTKPGFFDSLSPSNWTAGGVLQGAGVAVAGGALLSNLAKANTPPPGTGPIQNTAGAAAQTFQTQAATGGQLQTYLANGTLPAPQQAQIDQLVKAQKAKVISQYASRGQSTQPGTNSALDQDLAAIDQQGLVMAQQAETQLFQAGTQALGSGLTALGLSQQSYITLAQMDQAQNDALNKSIATFAGAAAGKGTATAGKGTTLTIG